MNYKRRSPQRKQRKRRQRHGYASEGKFKKDQLLYKEFIQQKRSLMR